MRTEKKTDFRKKRRLAGEILEFLLVSFAISAFTFCFLYFTSESLADTWLSQLGILLSAPGQAVLKIWLRNLCLTASVVIFLILFLFLLGQRITYLLKIIRGVDALQASRMDSIIPLEGGRIRKRTCRKGAENAGGKERLGPLPVPRYPHAPHLHAFLYAAAAGQRQPE